MRLPVEIVIAGAFAAGLLGPAHAQRGGGERSGPAQPPLWLPDEGVVFTDAPSFHSIDHAFYHTDLDTAAIVPEAGIEAAVRAFAKIIDEVNNVDLNGLKAPRRSEPER